MRERILKITTCCELYQKSKPVNFQTKGEYHSITTKNPLELIAVDLIGPLPVNRSSVQYILAILDHFTKFVKLYSLRRATTRAILYKIHHDFIPQWGLPKKFLGDNRPQFTSRRWVNSRLNTPESKLDLFRLSTRNPTQWSGETAK